MEQWVLLRKGADFANISRKFDISTRLASLMRNRDIVGDAAIEEYLHGGTEYLHDGMLMKDMDRAVELLKEKIQEGAKIRVIGDYDIDGVNASYILMEGLGHVGGDVDVDIPDRIMDGYGLNKNLIDRAFDEGIDTIVTCDNGIAAAEEIAYGKSLGMTIVVTDHHEVPFEEIGQKKCYRLPPADAVVDPKREDCSYPFSGLCGAGVAYKLVEALCEAMGHNAEQLSYLMEQVAIATVGDVMDLIGENRIFVRQGLRMLRHTKNEGLQALMECTKIQPEQINTYHIGYIIGPCMNAGGRLDTAKRALALLRAKTKKEAALLAGDLKALNDSRKEMTEAAVKQGILQVEHTALGKEKVLVVYLPDCHESLAGIVAGRIRERYYKPVFVLTDAEDGVKGSGRSIEAYHMYEELNRCGHLLTRYGGHKLAAGLSMKKELTGEFARAVNQECTLREEDLVEKVCIDMQLPLSCVTEGFVEELKLLEPFGKGNGKPVFAQKEVELLNVRFIGKNKNMLKMQARDAQGSSVEALYFGNAEAFTDYVKEKYGSERTKAWKEGKAQGIFLSVTYYPSVNEYMGRRTPQITITHYQ